MGPHSGHRTLTIYNPALASAEDTRKPGRNLISEIFDVARGLGLNKLMANMTPDQHGAQTAFRRLGFGSEALLADSVEERNGTSRDLVIMSFDFGGHSDRFQGSCTSDF